MKTSTTARKILDAAFGKNPNAKLPKMQSRVAVAELIGGNVIAVVANIVAQNQQALVASEGCGYFQGFIRARPMASDDFLTFAASEGQ